MWSNRTTCTNVHALAIRAVMLQFPSRGTTHARSLGLARHSSNLSISQLLSKSQGLSAWRKLIWCEVWCLAVDFCFADDEKAVDVVMFAELFIGWVGDWIVVL